MPPRSEIPADPGLRTFGWHFSNPAFFPGPRVNLLPSPDTRSSGVSRFIINKSAADLLFPSNAIGSS